MSSINLEAVMQALMPFLQPVIDAAVEQRLAQQLTPEHFDPQLTIKQTAKHLSVAAETVSSYLELPEDHPRRLKHVVMTDSARGRRIRLSEIDAWQQRNDYDALQEAARPRPKRPARRRGGN